MKPKAATPAPRVQSDAARKRRDLRRSKLRKETINCALQLFKKKGYDATTVNDIADAVGMSPRTFFRYFKTKDDAIFDWIDQQGEFMRPLLLARPAGEPPLQAMEHAFLELAQFHDANRRATNLLTHLVFDTESLKGRYHHEQSKWEDKFADILLGDRKVSRSELFAVRVQVSVASTTFVVAIRTWAAESRQGSLHPWVRSAFAALRASSKAQPQVINARSNES